MTLIAIRISQIRREKEEAKFTHYILELEEMIKIYKILQRNFFSFSILMLSVVNFAQNQVASVVLKERSNLYLANGRTLEAGNWHRSCLTFLYVKWH